jgi:hypothetical protein
MKAELKQLTKLTAAAVPACAVAQYPNPAESEIIFNRVSWLNLCETFRDFYGARKRNCLVGVHSQNPAQPAYMHIDRHNELCFINRFP